MRVDESAAGILFISNLEELLTMSMTGRAIFCTLTFFCLCPISATADSFWFEGVVLIEPAVVATTGSEMQGGMEANRAANVPVPVQFFMPLERRSDVALVMVPGGGLSSWSYTTTPDGRKGWAQLFAEAGIPVYLLNPPNGTRAELGRWNKESVWSLWGIGPEFGTLYPGSRFPGVAIEALEQSFYITRAGGNTAHLMSLLDEIGPSVVLGHSAGGVSTFGVARLGHPDLRGTIAVETTKCPTDPELLESVYVAGKRAFLSIWGDHLDRGAPSMLSRYASCKQASEVIAAAGGRSATVHLPADMNISGNTHLLMQDLNNSEIAALIMDWLRTEVQDF